jgi:3-hydroxyanthranilate 3,4-dioxygenase
MVVGGPNQRTDYHVDEGPEWFYQLEGEMVLQGPGGRRVRATSRSAPARCSYLPPRVPHSPQRMAGSSAW